MRFGVHFDFDLGYRFSPGGGHGIGSSIVENQVPRLISKTGVKIDRQPLALESLERVAFSAPAGR
jgi:hypothetical protein